MLYHCQNPILNVIGVEHMKWKAETVTIAPRCYSSLAFRIDGKAKITVNQTTYMVHTNDVLYLPQGLSYRAKYSDTELLVIHFNTEQNDPIPEVYTGIAFDKIYTDFMRTHVLWQEKKPGYEAYTQARLYDILGKLSENEITAQIPEYFLKSVSYINSNYREHSLSIDRICKHGGISPTGLRILFKKYYQITPIQYVTKLRLEYARNLISCGISIDRAAQESGFNDPKYFSRIVKKHFSCTPHQLKSYGK